MLNFQLVSEGFREGNFADVLLLESEGHLLRKFGFQLLQKRCTTAFIPHVPMSFIHLLQNFVAITLNHTIASNICIA